MMIKTACHDWSAQAQVPPGLVDRVLRTSRRRHQLKIGLSAASTALIVATAVAVVTAAGLPQPSSPPLHPAGALSSDTSLRVDPDTFPPTRLIAAGHAVLAAYDTARLVPIRKGLGHIERTWHVYDPI